MSLKPKTVRRLTLLMLIAVLAGGAVFSLFVVREWQNRRFVDRLSREALVCHEQGRDYQALVASATFLKRATPEHPAFADVLRVYCRSRVKVEERDYSHIRQAIVFYHRYLEHRPDDRAMRLELLDLLTEAGYWAEARDAAGRLLPTELAQTRPEDAGVLRCEALALLAMGNAPERLAQVLDRLAILSPLNVRNETIRLRALGRARPADAREYAASLLERNPGDPRAELLSIISRMIDRRAAEAADQWQRLCSVAGLDPDSAVRAHPARFPDADFAATLVEVFDQVGAFDHSLKVLEDACDVFDQPQLRGTLVRRLWQEGSFDDLVRWTSQAQRAEPESAELGLRALALLALKRPEQAGAIAARLAAREGDYRATTWSKAIPLADPESASKGPERVEALQDLVKASPYEPIFQVMLGDALAALGRTDEARTSWSEAAKSPLAVGWAAPSLRIAESCLGEQRFEEAGAAAAAALKLAPRSVAANVLWFDAQAALLERGVRDAAPPDQTLGKLERVLAGVPSSEDGAAVRRRLLPVRVLLLSRSGERDRACEAALSAIRGDRQLPAPILRRLISIGRSERLGFQDEGLAVAESRFGASPSLTLAVALDQAASGDPLGGLRRMQELARSRPDELPGQFALATYLERTGDADALKTWVQIGDGHPASLDAQRACLLSPLSATDPSFVERTVRRYRGLVGGDLPDDAVVVVARARALMAGSPGRRERDEAVALLGGLVGASPTLLEPRLLLAGFLALSDPGRGVEPDLPRAIALLAEASARQPRSAPIALQLAGLYQAQGEWAKAREQLTRVAGDPGFDHQARAEAARMLIRQGEPAPLAVAVLSELSTQMGERAPAAVLLALAEASAATGADEQAATAYDALAARAPDPASLLAAARYFAARDRGPRARAILGRLDSMQLSPGVREWTLARFEAAQGDPAPAAALFEAAVAAAPRRTEVWRSFAEFYSARGEHDKAVAVLDRAVAANGGDTSLATQRQLARAGAGGPAEVDQIIDLLAAEPSAAEAVRALRLFQQAARRGELQSADDLSQLADRFPRVAALQMLVARKLAGVDATRAAPLAARAQAALPADPAPARLACELYRRLGLWARMLDAAGAWRQRDDSFSPEPDAAIGEACLHLGQHERGLAATTPHVKAAVAAVSSPVSLVLLDVHARLLVASGRIAEARALLSPLLSASREVRISVWLPIAGTDVPNLEEARSWIEEVRPLLADSSPEDQLALVTVLDALSTRFAASAEPLLAEARELLSGLAANPMTATAPVIEALGVFRHRTGDIAGAEEAYRRAIALDPKRATALNNLASLSLERARLDEALDLAARACDAQPAAAYLDTLAQVHRARAAALETTNPEGARASHKAAAEALLRAAAAAPADIDPLDKATAEFERAGDPLRAAGCCESMLRRPALDERRAAYTKSRLARLLLVLKREGDAERARALADEAVRAVREPASLDALGWAELALGRPQQAAERFRAALAFPGMKAGFADSSSIGLALALAGGGERSEAERVLEQVKADTLDPALREPFRLARQAVQPER